MKEASLETPLKADLADDLLRFRRQVERECLINQVWSVATLVISTVLYLAVGVVFYSNFESWDVGDSLYFCIVTLGTVGFGGDGLEPSEPGTRLFTIFYIYVGILLILSRAGTLVDKIATGTRVKLNAIAEHEALSSGAIKGGRIRRGSSYGTAQLASAADIPEPPSVYAYYGINVLFANALLWSWVFVSAIIFCHTENWKLSYLDAVYFVWGAPPTASAGILRAYPRLPRPPRRTLG